jgi:hypothetical protein
MKEIWVVDDLSDTKVKLKKELERLLGLGGEQVDWSVVDEYDDAREALDAFNKMKKEKQKDVAAVIFEGVSHLIYVVVAGCVGERWTVQPRYFTA